MGLISRSKTEETSNNKRKKKQIVTKQKIKEEMYNEEGGLINLAVLAEVL